MAPSVLFVAQPAAAAGFFAKLRDAGYEVGVAETLSGAQAYVKKSAPVMVFSRVRLPGYRIETLLAVAADTMGAFPPVIAFTDAGSADEARRLLELGAHDYWLEPLGWDRLVAVLPGHAQRTAPAASPGPAGAPRAAVPAQETAPTVEIIGQHPTIRRVLALARQVAPSKATVLISGESGTGKEKFARYLHAHSDRAHGPFVAINCAALPEHLLESELFGHEKGAFTGAISRKLGRFELASGGTLLLDEISEMDLALQAKLLRVLQEGEIDRVGGTETVKVDVRVVATTNRRIESYVEEGKFRQDLYYRLNVIPLKLPPLRERGEDVLLLAGYFVARFCAAYSMARLEFSAQAREWLLSYDWPGNVRELQNLMERAVLLAGKGPIESRHFLLDADTWMPEEAEAAPAESGTPAPEADPARAPAQEFELPEGVITLEEMERRMILKSLDTTAGNRTQAAELLGISVRTLRNKLNEYRQQGLNIP